MVHIIQACYVKIVVGFMISFLLSGTLALAQERVEQELRPITPTSLPVFPENGMQTPARD